MKNPAASSGVWIPPSNQEPNIFMKSPVRRRAIITIAISFFFMLKNIASAPITFINNRCATLVMIVATTNEMIKTTIIDTSFPSLFNNKIVFRTEPVLLRTHAFALSGIGSLIT